MSRNSRVVVQQLLGSGNRNIPCAARKLLPGCNFIQPQTLTSIPSSRPSPIYRPFSSSVCARYRNEYDSTAEKIRDRFLDAVCCFYANQSMHLALIVQAFVERFPHVKIYHFHVFNLRKDDTYAASMRALNVSRMPVFHFFQNGKKVDALVGDSFLLLDKSIKNLYNTQELDTQANEVKDHIGAVEGRDSKVCTLSE